MPINHNQLLVEVAAYAGQDAAVVAAALNVPIKTPRADRVTSTTLGNVWGPVKAAAFRSALKAANNSLADYVLALIDGNGFDPGNESTPAVADELVRDQLCSREDADAAIYASIILPCDDVVTADDVTAARAEMDARDAQLALERRVIHAYNAAMAAVQAGERDLAVIQQTFDQDFVTGEQV